MPSSVNPTEKLNFSTSHNDLIWNDSPDNPLNLYATSKQSTFEGGYTYLGGCVGYKKIGAGYKFLTYTNAELEIPSQLAKEHTNENQVTYLVVKSDPNQDMNTMPPSGAAEPGYIGAIIKTGNPTYPALVIQMKLSNTNDENVFNQILSTFKVSE